MSGCACVPKCVCVWECLRQLLSTSWCIWSSGNHSLSMYGSSCGSPCLFLHARRECHNTFTSHSSTSSQGQRAASAPANSCTVAPYICMHTRTVYACLYARLLICPHACLTVFIHVQTLVRLLVNSAVMLANVICTVARGWADHLTLINSSSIHCVGDNRVSKQDPKHLKVRDSLKAKQRPRQKNEPDRPLWRLIRVLKCEGSLI